MKRYLKNKGFLEDEIKGLYSYEALKQRLIGNPFAVYEKKGLI